MTARDDAVQAMEGAFDGADTSNQVFEAIEATLEGAGYLPLFEHLLDAIPDEVLAELAIERGALVAVDVGVGSPLGELFDAISGDAMNDVELYRVVES